MPSRAWASTRTASSTITRGAPSLDWPWPTAATTSCGHALSSACPPTTTSATTTRRSLPPPAAP
eukprot:2853009-Pyramimonas_sp.AAC.1